MSPCHGAHHMGKHDPEALNYRPEIDGLRAVAVLSVVVFHAEPRIFPGGYVGVDSFVVISGFLITSLILRQLDLGTFRVTVGIVSVSFAINVILVSLWQAADMYFLPPIRVWELLLGGALAHVHIFRKQELENYLTRCAAVLPTWRFITIENIQATTGL